MILDIIVHRFGIIEVASLTGVLCGLLLHVDVQSSFYRYVVACTFAPSCSTACSLHKVLNQLMTLFLKHFILLSGVTI